MNMTQEEIARRCSSAPTVCGFGKCPFLDICNHNRKECVMHHIAMMLRSNLVELNKRDKQLSVMQDIVKTLCLYEDQLEDMNRRYRDIYTEYQARYKPEPKRKKPRRKVTYKNATKFDGNPLYADETNSGGEAKDVII